MPRTHRPRRSGTRTASPEPVTDGPVLDLEVDRIAHGGVAVARHDGRVVFVSDAIPGERVRARVTDVRKDRFWRAETVEVLDASPDRREHVWAEASVDRAPEHRAGGAEFGHIRMSRQRELKREVLTEALQRFAQLERDVVVEPVDEALAPGADAESGTGWRTRVRLHVDDAGRVGPYAARSHRVVPVTDLPLAVEELRALAPLGSSLPGAGSIDLIAPGTGEPAVVVDQHGAGPLVHEIVDGREFALDRGGFWQVHRGAAATLSRAVRDLVDGDRFDPGAANLDLYGGVGLLAAAVGDRFGETVRITSVEADARATDHAAANLADWVGARAETGRVDRWLGALEASADRATRDRLAAATVILDPPRSGAGREVVERLAALRPAQLVYVACDPVALARDVGTFRAHGYELEAIRAFDLFPSTHHVEAVARLAATL
ncbi:class I SAM-dependent RNA methyltransferase [Agromyces aerolatus]|uniref:class I SAM-dependent RNA methyltransferase n=1 Tax=Agromyces sp. LY-1074 TaxID=3074080 RepID=UPI00285B1C99|nr:MULTISPECIES: TRAM domain-containing protein [unclassified Agromyces]MDR5700348.1 TRAM domain-containing protein [Agromyces sp. LY-1074]MDR5706674.1 TRAM domain-containing protein [Agromyces sp. LY-1358]